MSIAIAPDLAALAREVRMVWVGRQSEAFLAQTGEAPIRYLDVEGAIRSSKTTQALWAVHANAHAYPGIRQLICRWTDDALLSTVKPLWREILRQTDTEYTWNPEEHRDEILVRDDDGREIGRSWVYLRGLRSSEDRDRFGKFRGLTLARIVVDQAEELPEDTYLELKGRLSQRGFPQQLVLLPNPPGLDHWLAREFPEANTRANHRLIRLTLRDNAHNLDPAYVEAIEADYPEGHPMRRRLLEGRRGLAVHGKPVYAGYFNRDRMAARQLAVNPHVPLIECVDFGHHRPCVLWCQFLPIGALHWLGGVMGEDLFLEDFAPIVGQFRAQWFPEAREVWACCDPAGSKANASGVKKTGVQVLQDNGIYPRWVESSNQPEVRMYAVETLGGYMRRDRFRADPERWWIVSEREQQPATFALDALEAGYVWDPKPRTLPSGKRIAVPLKDGYYEHVMNCGEYGVLNFGPPQPGKAEDRQRVRQAERAAPRDYDPDDTRRRRGTVTIGSRGGY